MTSEELSRRDAIKAMAGAAAAIAVVPALGKLDILQTKSNSEENPAARFEVGDEPLVVLVSKDSVMGFKGFDEYAIEDRGLGQRIRGAFATAKVQKN